MDRHLNEFKKYQCPGYFSYLLLLVFSITIFLSIFGYIKFTFLLFLEAFKILFMKKKTFLQRHIEINEKRIKAEKLNLLMKMIVLIYLK